MFERDARFRVVTGRAGSPLDAGPSNVATSSKVRLDARIQAMEKDRAKLEARASRAEEKVKELQGHSAALLREKKQMQADMRILGQKHERMQAQQASKVKGQSQRVHAAQQLKEQVQMYEVQHAELQAQFERLNAQHARCESDRGAATDLEQGLRQKLKAVEAEADESEHRIWILERQLNEEKRKREQTMEAEEDYRARLDVLQAKLEASEEERNVDLKRLEWIAGENDRLQSALHGNEEEEQGLIRQRSALIAASLRLAGENSSLKHACDQQRWQSRLQNLQIRRLEQSSIELRRQNKDLNEALTLARTEHSIAAEVSRVADTSLELSNDTMEEAEEPWERWVEHLEEERRTEIAVEAQQSLLLLDCARLEVEWKQRIIDRMQSDLEDIHDRYLDLLRQRNSQPALQHALDKARKDLSAVEEAYEAGVLEVMQSHESQEQIKAQLHRAQTENAVLTERIQKLDGLQVKLKHTKMREETLLQERQELLDDLARSSNYEAAYYGIRAEAQKLLTRLTAREVQAQELTSLNVALASHNNPNQKIFYLDRIRSQLDDTRVQYRELEEERNTLHRRCRDLQDQLNVFIHVDPGPNTAILPSAPLDEREAARRAWQQRPKTRLTRVGRGGDVSIMSSSTNAPLRELPSRIAFAKHNALSLSLDGGQTSDATAAAADDSGEVCSFSSGNSAAGDRCETPKRRYLRAQRSDMSFDRRASPVATLPSIDALAWELDKENLSPGQDVDSSKAPSPSPRTDHLLDGELTLQDLTGF